MLKASWNMTTIQSHSDFEKLKNIVESVKPKIGAFDTETNGLHIMYCKPFVVQFGFLDLPNMRGFTFAVDLENNPEALEILDYWNKEAEKLEIYMGMNTKFDMHMLKNIGKEYLGNNLTDGQFYIRFAHDALQKDEGGPPLALKEYCTKYIDRTAKYHERLLAKERTEIAKIYNNRLKVMLNESSAKLPEGVKAKSFTIKVVEDIFKDCVFEKSDLPDDIREVYEEWLQTLPEYLRDNTQGIVKSENIRYNDLDREKLLTYAHYDIVYTLEIWLSTHHIVEHRKQEIGLKIENECIRPWFEMERTGFMVDKDYIEDCRIKLKKYILKQRAELCELAGREIAIGQSAEIINTLKDKFGITTNSTKKEVLKRIKNETDNQDAKRFITLLQELRTLEKWYSTYIIRFQHQLKLGDKLYTTIKQVETVSGRVASDFQQFPKDAIKTEDGEEIFQPRKMVKTNTAIVYLDYSQIELRLQALYTYLLGKPDLNMCRAYMPYKCYRIINGDYFMFNPENYNDIKNYKKYKWYHDEDGTEWEPLDIHGATTLAAFPGLKKTDPEFHRLRYIGKTTNFAKNYGAELGRIRDMFPDKTLEECKQINDAYYKAFPGIKIYHEFCKQRALKYSNTQNLFGVRYYNVNGHKMKNLLIQGSGAYFLKIRLLKLYKFCKENNIKSKLQMQIHDELSWEWDKEDPPEVFFQFKELMEDWDKTKVPIIADMEVTTTTWAEKVEVETLEELKGVLENV